MSQQVFKALYDAGCPTYICRDGSRTRNGRPFCHYCDADLSDAAVGDYQHYEGCYWIKIMELANKTDATQAE